MSADKNGTPITGGPQPPPAKKKRDDFTFSRLLGEGSYSTVVLATEKSTGKTFAMKVLEKRHIVREKKGAHVMREKDVLSKLNHPFFVRLYFTFQTQESLYFGLSYAKRGELFAHLQKVGCLDMACARFYAAEVVLALEHLHGLFIIHRDLKPENILLSDDWHIQIIDFGTAKILSSKEMESKTNSFVGTAQYVSPEILNTKRACFASDLWALGCIIFQFLSGNHLFFGGNDYIIFQKVLKMEFTIPESFPSVAADIVRALVVMEPSERLGCREHGGFAELKAHPFFKDIDWDNLPNQKPPAIRPYLPAQDVHSNVDVWENWEQGTEFDDLFSESFQPMDLGRMAVQPAVEHPMTDERKRRLQEQAEWPWGKFCKNELIIHHSRVDKHKGHFAQQWQLILTDRPRLFGVDPESMVVKKDIPLKKQVNIEVFNSNMFFLHTPNRTFYFISAADDAEEWAVAVRQQLIQPCLER